MSLDLSKSGFNIEAEKASKTGNEIIKYGTAGFRSKAEDLNHILYRIGILSVLRSKKKNGQTIGLMITASHNPEQDNGVKLIDPYGEMLEQSWEKLATDLANADDNNLTKVIENIIQDEKIDLNIPASVFLGRDTRSSSPKLLNLAVDGVKSANGGYKDYGIVTTPVLHYMVYSKNVFHKEPSENDYDLKLSNAFKKLNDGASSGNYTTELLLDGANGVGAIKVKQMEQYLKDVLRITIYNNGDGILNHKCGADFVKVEQKASEGVTLKANARCVSLDGDADRLIYYYIDDNQVFHMLDGDRIAILIAEYLIKLVRESKVNVNLGLVQTAYANGGSTNYITNTLKIPVACVPTGVKHLHHKALEFDIGVYFEANGHGTVIYSKKAEETIRSKADANNVPESEKKAAENLLNMIDLTNQTVGDAFSDVLLVETVLRAKGWSLADWEKIYTDLPNRQLKVTIKDRNVIKTTDAERVCVSPEGLQDKINELVKKYENGRSFVRPSGTEDVVRVYAESSTQGNADKLASEVALAVYQFAGGVGNPPVIKS